MDLGLGGKACVIAGASRGIGRATAKLLSAEGARVLLVARGEYALEAAAAECGGDARVLALDVTDPDAGERAADACQEHFGAIDGLVVCAGTTYLRPLAKLKQEDWDLQWQLSVLAPWRLMAAAAPRMAAAGGGAIVNVASSSGKRPSLRNAAYSVGKAAQLSLSRAFADEWAGRGVRVNAIAPGIVTTELWTGPGQLAEQAAAAEGSSPAEVLAAQAAKLPRGELGSPEEIAAVIAFLLSPAAANVVGAAWSVDGGAVPVIL